VADPQLPVPPSGAKTALRDQLLTARNRRPLTETVAAAQALAEVVTGVEDVRRAATVSLYVSVDQEPGTGALLEALAAAGKRVILPCWLPGNDLDWAVYQGADALVRARFGLLEPAGPRLGPEAIATADAVLLPGLAADDAGFRLGRGGGCYDRALTRVPVGTFTCVLLYPDEIGIPVPIEPHDRPVTTAASAAGLTRFHPR